jgi:hypothetical protein
MKSLSVIGDLTLEASWSAYYSSISDSRATVRGRRKRRPEINSFVSTYMGIGETRTDVRHDGQ